MLCVSGDKDDEECMEMDEEIFEIMVNYTLNHSSLIYFGDIFDF